jgi:sulfur carrier protein
MKVRINGEDREVGNDITVAELLEELKLRPGRVVIELNRDIISREQHSSTLLKQGDVLEIVHFVGGG